MSCFMFPMKQLITLPKAGPAKDQHFEPGGEYVNQ